MRIWLLTNTPSPYQLEFLAAIDEREGCQLDVRLMDEEHRGRSVENVRSCLSSYQVLHGVGPRVWSDAFRIHPKALREACRGQHDIFVLSGQYTSLTAVCCVMALKLRGKPFVFWLEQPWPDGYRPAWSRSIAARYGWARGVRKAVLARMVKAASCVFCIGTAAVEAYRRLGVSPDRMVNMPYHCDVRRFAKVDEDRAAALREELGVDTQCVFLFSGQLVERKGVDDLIAAFEEVGGGAMLVVLGDGPLRKDLEAAVNDRIKQRVYFAGHVEQEELPIWFALADVFVFPSRHDGWGVVINEACAAGLPVIVTKSTGAAIDLVSDGVNGYVVNRDDPKALSDAMSDAMSNADKRREYGMASRERIGAFTLEKGAGRFCARLAEIGKGRVS